MLRDFISVHSSRFMSIIEQETLNIETEFDNGINMIYEDYIFTNPQVGRFYTI